MSENNLEKMTLEMIRFLKKWGLWSGVSILANGSRYSAVSDEGKRYRGESCVAVTNPALPETYTAGLTSGGGCRGDLVWRSFANPDHLFDMIYEGPLYMLLNHDTYETDPRMISEEAWEEIFENTSLVREYILEKYDLCDVRDLLERERASGDILNNPELSAWDPLVFDTWEEYLAFRDGEESGLKNVRENYDTYADYEKAIEQADQLCLLSIGDVLPVWKQMEAEARNHIKAQSSLVSLPEMTGSIRTEFDAIFDRYHLWYEPGFSWSLTCYKSSTF